MAEDSAREAVTAAALHGDAVTLRAVAADLPPLESHRYERRRAAAFAAAIEGDRDRAFTQLALGGVVPGQRRQTDAAMLELLLGRPDEAMAALRRAVKDQSRIEPEVPALLAECVRRGGAAPRKTTAAGRRARSAGDRTWTMSVGAPLPSSALARGIVPVVTVLSLVVAIVTFGRLPGLGAEADQELGLSAPPSHGPVVVVATPPPRVARPRRVREEVARPVLVAARAPAPAPRRGRTYSARRATTTPSNEPAAPLTPTAASESIGSPPQVSQPPAAIPPADRPHGKALGHAKRAQRERREKSEHSMPASLPAPDSSPAVVPAAEHPSPPEHSNGHGRDDASGQRKKP